MLPVLNFGVFQIPSFFLVLSVLMGLVFFLTTVRSRQLLMPDSESLDLSLILVVSALVGARLTHVIIENWDYYLETPVKVFYFWEGGFVFYGGLVLSFGAGMAFLGLKKQITAVKKYMRLYTPILSLSYCIGRLGCFLEGCCYGKFCRLPWAVEGRHPTQIYSSIWEAVILVFLIMYERKNETKLEQNPERLFYFWLLLHSLGRGLIEFLRDDYRGDWPLVSPSTWMSGVLLIIAAGYFYRCRK